MTLLRRCFLILLLVNAVALTQVTHSNSHTISPRARQIHDSAIVIDTHADTPQRFEFEDVDLVVNIRPGVQGEENLVWVWTDDVDWEPKVRMKMSSETANKYFQGKENVAVALARRRIKSGGDVKAALSLIPITKPIYARYRDYLQREHPHLLV